MPQPLVVNVEVRIAWWLHAYPCTVTATLQHRHYQPGSSQWLPGTDIHDGFGMPATLLNYWVVIHPPTIFLGLFVMSRIFPTPRSRRICAPTP